MKSFHKTMISENSKKYILDALTTGNGSGDGYYTKACEDWISRQHEGFKVQMTTSGTHALELAGRLIKLQEGDEVILPSFTFPSTANAFLLCGANLVFSEVEEKHLTLDPLKIEEKITKKTKAIVVVHYGGICCDMDPIMELAQRYGLFVIEDAAQSFLSKYKGKLAGTLGDFGCFSFHGTKDVISGEGGALLIKDKKFYSEAGIYRQKGTNREDFLDKKEAFYQWVALGSSYSPSDFLMAILYGQLEMADEILSSKRERYHRYLAFFREKGCKIQCAYSTKADYCEENGHLFYLIFPTTDEALHFQEQMRKAQVPTATHFVPLHESLMGRQFLRDKQEFLVEKALGQRLIRLPLYASMKQGEQEEIFRALERYFDVC